jgi:hypothetical protein
MSGTHLNVFFGGIFQNTVVPLSMPHLSGQISDALKSKILLNCPPSRETTDIILPFENLRAVMVVIVG